MADPLTPEQIQALTEAQNANTQAVVANNDAVNASSNGLFGLSAQTGSTNTTLSNFNGTIAKQTGLFNLLQTSILGSQNAFAGLNNIDPRSITTFSGHFNDLQLALKESGPVAQKAQEAIKGMGLQLERSGFKDFIGAGKMAASTILGLIQNITKNADAAIEFEGAMLQTAAATGEFGKMMSLAGPDMEKLNVLLDNQVFALDMASKATNSTREQIKGYYDTLRMVPGAMNQMVNANAAGTEKLSMLTATIKLAHGTGRSYNEVVKDLHKSFTDYSISGEAALKLTARFSEIANKYGVELGDVRNGIMAAADAFKNMGDAGDGAAKMQEGVNKMMDTYIQRLKDSGMSGKHAVETVQGVTSAMAGLNIAQKAFLSSQTGGPGGLMGGFQIEKMIKDNDFEGLQKKMMQTMQRQFGKIVTLDDATKSQGAAAQLEKQTLMLRQGPMGSMVKTDQDAYRFLDAMKAQQEGRPTKGGPAAGLDPNVVQNAIKTGSTWEQKTHTIVGDISNDLRAIRNRLMTTGLNEVQGAFTSAVTPNQGVLTENQLANQKNLKDSFAEAQLAGARESKTVSQEMKEAGPLRANRTEDRTRENYEAIEKSLSNIPSAVKSGLDTVWRPAETGTPTPPINTMIDQRRQAQGGTAPPTPASQVRDATGKVLPSFLQNMGPAPSPGARVGAATRAPAPPRETVGVNAQNNTGAPRAPQPNVTVQQQGDSGRINVKVIVTEEPSSTNADSISKASSISP